MQVLGSLIRPKADGSSRALHDYVGTQATEDACFIFLGGGEIGDGDVFCFDELCVAYGASVASLIFLPYKAKSLDAFKTKDVTEMRANRQYGFPYAHMLHRCTNLQVVTSARWVSSFLHLRSLQVSGFSIRS